MKTLRLTNAALLTAALAGLSVGFSADHAMGQIQAQNGNALDANQQVGSGGYNAYAQQPDYRARNLLVTGNVGGGRAFQGSIGYSAPGAFRGTLGSDRLFGFNRDSIYSAPGAANLNIRDFGDRVILTRPTTTAPGYLVNTGNALTTGSSYDAASGTLSFRQSGGGLVAVAGVNDISQLRAQAGRLGIIRTRGGQARLDPTQPNGLRYDPLDPTNPNPSTREAPQPTDPDREADPTLDPSISPGLRIDGKRESKEVENQTSDLNVNAYPLAHTLGTQVQSVMARKIAGLDDKNLTLEQANALRNQLYGKIKQAKADAAKDPAAGDAPPNPYEKLIADIIKQAEEKKAGEQAADANKPDTRPAWQKAIERPEEAIMDAKRKAREAALRVSLGMVDANGNPDFSQKLPTIDPDSELGKLLAELDYDLPAVTTLAGDKKTRINTLLARGEQEIKDARYIMAETIYRQAVRETRGKDPLAKAGLVHSQMGAGMIRSAAFNLRGLFSSNPELIALRYDKGLLPKPDRLAWLQGQLQEMIKADRRVADPGLVIAYLGYQVNDKELIEYGLSTAEAAAPRDPLMPVLRKIWIDKAEKKSDDKKDAEKAPAKEAPAKEAPAGDAGK